MARASMTLLTRASILVAFATLALICARSAAAKDNSAAAAETLIREGIELRRLSDDAAALTKFHRAVTLAPTPRALAQLGLCELAVGRFAKAVEHLTASLRATNDKWMTTNKAVVRESLEQAKARVGRIEVAVEPAGAHVTLNGEKVGDTPLPEPIVVDEGSVDLQIELEGFVTQQRSVAIKGGQYQKMAFTLSAPQAAVTPLGTPSTVASEGVTSLPLPARAQPAWVAPTKWSLLGAAGLGFGFGIYGWVHQQSLVGSFEDAGCKVDRRGDPGFVGDGSFQVTKDCTQRFDDMQSAKTLRTVGLAAGALFLAGYIGVVVLTHGKPADDAHATGPRLSCAPGVASMVCVGSF